MFRVAIVGDKGSVLSFRALGLNAYAIDKPEEVRDIWPQIIEEGYAVIFVTETLYLQIKDLLPVTDEGKTPIVLIIPEATGGTKLGVRRIKETVEKAIGVDIVSGKAEEGEEEKY
jgi:V/A-type H+-transporting ATPase subunit F